jgi:hypothetical protein
VSLADYLEGLAVWAAVAACCGAASFLLFRGRVPGVAGIPRLLGLGLVFIAALLAAQLGPGILGVLGHGPVLLAAAVLPGLAWIGRERAVPVGGGERCRLSPLPRNVEWALAGAGIAIVSWLMLAALLERAPVAVTNLDALNFHLPGIGAWIQDGSLWPVHQWVPDLAHGNYPQNGDLLDLSVVLPWHNDAFVRLTGFPLLAMAALAVYAIGEELGAPRPAAVGWATAFAAMPAVLQPATLEVLTDDLLIAALGAGLLFLLRFQRTGARADLLLAGLGLGIAFGTKWYGVSSVAVILAAWTAAELLARTHLRVLGRRLAALAGLVTAAGGFWLLRNCVESGNPVFPVRIELLGSTVFDAPFDSARAAAGFTIASYLDDPGILAEHILSALAETVALPGLLMGVAALAALLLALRDRRGAGDRRIALLAATSLLLAAAYAATPYSALGAEGEPALAEFNVRYLVPALLAAAPLAAWLSGRLAWLRLAGPLLALLATAQAARLTAQEIGSTPLVQAAAVVLAGAVFGLWLASSRPSVLRRRRTLVAAGVVLCGLAIAGGHELQGRFNDSRYTDVDPAFAWASDRAPDGAVIGLAGDWGVDRESPVWPMYGPRLENEVLFAGQFKEGMLRRYRSREAFLEGIRADGINHLLVARGEPPRREVAPERWARSGGFQPILRSERFTLFGASGSG